MGLQFSHSVGYRGLCALDGTVVLCTGGNISLTQEPIMGSGVWGAGYMNVAPISYAYNYLSLEGSSSFELTINSTGGGSNVWNKLKETCVTDRALQHTIMLKPDGHNGFNGNGWASSLSFEASEGAAVTGSFNFKGDPSGNNITADGDNGWGSQTGAGTDEQKLGYVSSTSAYLDNLVGSTLVPYWRTGLSVGKTVDEMQSDPSANMLQDVISWSVNYNSDLQMLKCCRYETTSPLSADYILCGEATCDGSYTIFRLAGDFAPGAYHQRRQNFIGWMNFGSESAEGSGTTGAKYTEDHYYIRIPYILVNSGSTSMTSGAQYVSTEFSFTGLGDGKNAIIDMR